MTTRVVAGAKRARSGGEESKDSKKQKTAAVKAEEPAAAASGRVIEIPEDERDKIGEEFDIWALP